jgi:hypothetical protein
MTESTMSLLDGKLAAPSLFDRMTSKGFTATCGITFVVSLIALPLIGFGAFTARDEDGWITAFMAITSFVLLASGVLLVALAIVAWIQREDPKDRVSSNVPPTFSSRSTTT